MRIPHFPHNPDSLQAVARVSDKETVSPGDGRILRHGPRPSDGQGVEYERSAEIRWWTSRLHEAPVIRDELVATIHKRLAQPEQYLTRSAAEGTAAVILGDR